MDIPVMTLNGEKIFNLVNALGIELEKFLYSNKMTVEEIMVAIYCFKNRATAIDNLPSDILEAFDKISKTIITESKKDNEAKSIDDLYLDSLPVPSKDFH